MNIKRNIIGISALFLSFVPFTAHAANDKVYWNDGYGKVYYSINSNPSPVVKVALDMFADDMKAVVGYAAKEKANANIQVYQLDQLNNKEFAALEKLGTPIHQFITKSDAFWMGTRQGKVIIVGSDARGTAYGIMELSRMAGVSPWKDYFRITPLQRKVLSTPTGFESLQIPSVHYRGLLLNNSEWMKSKNYSRLCRLMLRLKANVLWQADSKHEVSYNKEVTDSFGILVGEEGKVTELMGKKHKKHKKNIDEVKTLWEDAQISFASMSPALVCHELTNNTSAQHKGKSHKTHSAHTDGAEAWIANVTTPEASTFNLSLFMDLAWNQQAVGTKNLESYLSRWISAQFGDNLGNKILPVIKEYYRLTNIRPTAYMSMPYGDWEFHSGEFGNELERYLYDFDKLKVQVEQIEKNVPSYLKPTFRQSVKTPIYIAALTAEKELEAQEARHIARPGLFEKDEEAKAAAALSLTAYQKLKAIQPSASAPALPGTLSNAEIKECLKDAFDRTEDLKPLSYSQTKDIIAKNAYQWTSTSLGDNKHNDGVGITTIPLLGHSIKAVALPQGASLNYVVNSDAEGDARFTIASIPDYQNEKSDLRVSVSIDHAEPVVISLKDAYNHSTWKMDIWRGQTRKSFFTTLSKGNHTVEIKALDDNIILDQWVLDFDVDRAYYVFPTQP